MDNTQLATRALAAEITKKVRERGLVLWIDAERHYTAFVDALARPGSGFAYPVVGLRGSYLELMLALEPYGNGLHPEHVLVHLPGLNKDSVKETPVYELYKAGIQFEKNLATLVREAAVGVARPDDVEAFLRQPALSLEKADAWLASLRAEPKDQLTMLIEALGVDDIAIGIVADDPRLRAHLPHGGPQIVAFLERGLGISGAFRAFRLGERELSAAAVATLTASWLMAVEFVHDLNEPPVMPELAALKKLGPVAKDCRRLATRLRREHPDTYELFANELQEQLANERTSHHASALGSIDTFRFEEATTRAAAIGALARGDWSAAHELATARTPKDCFWVERSQKLQRTWEVVRLAAITGQALAATAGALAGSGSLDEAVERYADKLAPVDRHHRLFEQRAHALISPDLDDHDGLLDVRSAVRRAYREWANTLNRAFFKLCVEHGPLPGRSLRQRAVYEDVVHPLLERGERVAFLLVDALRFEMAQAFAQELKADKYQVHLSPRLAELPTETKIGMNALAPIEKNGRLRVAMRDGSIVGFKGGEVTVSDPKTRVRAMSDRSTQGLAESFELEELHDLTVTQMKRRLAGKPRLIVVHSRDLDAAGEHGLHLGSFEPSLALLKSALSLLQQAGVERFVLCSDHGFLLQDASAENVPFGTSMRVPERRHALLPQPSGMPDVLEVRLSALDYDAPEDMYLVFRPDTALWQTKEKVAPFVHGGNSLQERVIPVLVAQRQAARGKAISKYEVAARAEPAHLGRQRLRLAVRLQTQSSASLGFHGPKMISLALRVPARPDIVLRLLDAGPPASLEGERLLLPPNKEESLVEFELEGAIDEKVRVEVFHPDAIEQVAPKVVEGFFDVQRDRRLGKPRVESEPDGGNPAPVHEPATPVAPAQSWTELVTDEAHRRVLQIIAERRTINEAELEQVLGSPRRVRAFARHFDDIVRLVPFEIEVVTAQGMKAYKRKD